jgi:hypothetical protein
MQKAGLHFNKKGKIQRYRCIHCRTIRLGEIIEESVLPEFSR